MATKSESEVKSKEKQTELGAKKGKGVGTVIKIGARKEMVTTPIPPVDKDKFKVLEIYPIEPEPEEPATMDDKPHYSYVRVLEDTVSSDVMYETIEPPLEEREKDILEYLEDQLLEELDYRQDEIDEEEEKKNKLRKTMNEVLFHSDIALDALTKERLFYYVYRDLIGYGRIHVTMKDPMLEDISCDGHGVPIYVYHRNHHSIRSDVKFNTEEELNRYVIQLAQKCGRDISKANPILDTTMPDGSRLNTSLGTEITTRGSTFTIRRFKEVPLTIIDLINYGTVNTEVAAFLWLAVQYGASMMCAGGTASGKTTTLNAVALFIPPSSKVFTIEDTREMNIPHENWVPGLTREIKDEDEGGGARNIDMFELLKTAMRQRPDYMVVGEVRGKETMIVFQAMATGQTVYSTLHADSVESVVHRLENPPINVPRILVLSLNFVLLQGQVRVRGKKTRRIKQIAEIWDIDPETNHIRVTPVFTWSWTSAGDQFRFSGTSKFLDKVADLEGIKYKDLQDEIDNRTIVLDWLLKRLQNDESITYKEVFKTIQSYYQDPDAVIKEAKEFLSM